MHPWHCEGEGRRQARRRRQRAAVRCCRLRGPPGRASAGVAELPSVQPKALLHNLEACMLARLHVQGVYELARACPAAAALCAECRRAPAPAARLAPTTPGCRADRLGGARASWLAGCFRRGRGACGACRSRPTSAPRSSGPPSLRARCRRWRLGGWGGARQRGVSSERGAAAPRQRAARAELGPPPRPTSNAAGAAARPASQSGQPPLRVAGQPLT